MVSGIRTAVDPKPLDGTDELTDALIDKRDIYTHSTAGKLAMVPLRLIGDAAASGYALYATHPCMAAGTVRSTPVEVAAEGPQQAPVTPGEPQGGFRPVAAPVSGSQGHTAKIKMADYWGTSRNRANRVSLRPSRCILCKGIIRGDENNIVAIEYDGRIVWAYHVDD